MMTEVTHNWGNRFAHLVRALAEMLEFRAVSKKTAASGSCHSRWCHGTGSLHGNDQWCSVFWYTSVWDSFKSARHISLMSWMLYKRWKILQSFETRFRTLSKSWMRPIGSATLDRKIRKPVITVFLPASWSFWCGCSMARVRLESLRYSQWISMPVFVVALVHAQTQPMPTTSGMRNVGIPWPELLSCNQLPFSDRVLFQRQSAPPKEIFPLCGCKRKKYFNNEAALTELNKFDDLMRWDSTDQPLSWLLKK